MSKKKIDEAKSNVLYGENLKECPFREFRDNELSPDYWGLGPSACRAAIGLAGKVPRTPADFIWVDDQTQPLPSSVRQYLNGWIRAEDLASDRWKADIVVYEENNGEKMKIGDTQLSHAQVLMRSSFCRKVLSACFILERVEGLMIEHQWENFMFALGPEGWRAKYHIYSPGMKPGGGSQHRPGLSKNGCYLVRLFYFGAWRCVWVSDQVPVDATDSPLLPFSPLISRGPVKPGVKGSPPMVVADVVYLWPLLICKALLKLAAPDMRADDDSEIAEDEEMSEFDIMHALTGCLLLNYTLTDSEALWKLFSAEIPSFSWDEDDDTLTSAIKSKALKKPSTKENVNAKKCSIGTVVLKDTKNQPPYLLPGITPGHEMTLLVTMIRDVPIKKPLQEPEVALWKYYRWVEWAKGRGLYDAYACPRTRFLKVNGLMKLSYAPHLLDVQSAESITYGFKEENDKGHSKKQKIDPQPQASFNKDQFKEDLREWVQFDAIRDLIKYTQIMCFPSMFEFASAASNPPIRIMKAPPNRAIDMPAPKCAPLYLQIDGPDEILLRLSLSTLNPELLINSGVDVEDDIEPAYLILEEFKWFEVQEFLSAKSYIATTGFGSAVVRFLPGRHFCRLWVHSRMNWYVMLLSESNLLLGSRDTIQVAAVKECPWASRFLNNLSVAFLNWTKINRSNSTIMTSDREFFRSYQPDLCWDVAKVGFSKSLVHWMFRQALQSLLIKRLPAVEYRSVCHVLRHYFCDPDFGLPPKPPPPMSLRNLIAIDPCDCLMPEEEELMLREECLEEQTQHEQSLVGSQVMAQLLTTPVPPAVSQVCELATPELPCGILKDERDKVVKKHEAAAFIQACWRGTFARKCLFDKAPFTNDVLKLLMDNAFGNLEALSALMNEFFLMYPSVKPAYSVASALSGVMGVYQQNGIAVITSRCKWIPYFQAVFYCHSPVKCHIDMESTLPHSTVLVYNNDSGESMRQVYNSDITFDFTPNVHGYTVMGHGTLTQRPPGIHNEVHWQLTVLSSVEGAFHCCNDLDECKETPFQQAYKLHVDEIFLPNRRHILGGLIFYVAKREAISFRVAATSPELEMLATLRIMNASGDFVEIAQCFGKGEIHWPYIQLKPPSPLSLMGPMKKKSASQACLRSNSGIISTRSLKAQPKNKPNSGKKTSALKVGDLKSMEQRVYSIQVTAPKGWPLTVSQWRRVAELRNSVVDIPKVEPPKKAPKPTSGKDKDKDKDKEMAMPTTTYTPIPDDAYVELECSLTAGGGTVAKRDDIRDLEFFNARRAWEAEELNRNFRGAQIRNDFRSEFVLAPPSPPTESSNIFAEEMVGEFPGEEEKKEIRAGPTPATDSEEYEMKTIEEEEDAKFLMMPELLRDKFIPLSFVQSCTKEKNDDGSSVVVTPNMSEAAKTERHARINAAIDRMKELQIYNEIYVLGRQKKRAELLETLFVDSQWCPELHEVFEEREDAIAQETLARTLSAKKKLQEQKLNKK